MINKWKEVTRNRDEWRSIVLQAKADPGCDAIGRRKRRETLN